jgi:hypothetical protein
MYGQRLSQYGVGGHKRRRVHMRANARQTQNANE